MSDWHTLYNALSYVYGNCTQYVAGTFSWVGARWGNGCQWADSAKAAGFTVSPTPVKNSIAVYRCDLPGSGGAGHVAKVEDVASDGFTLSEANWSGFNTVDVRKESLGSSTGQYIIGFIMPPGVSAPTGTSTLSSNPLDPSGLTDTLSAIGDEIAKDLMRVALSLLGFFVLMVGIGLLLSDELRSDLKGATSKIPGAHGLTATEGLKESSELAA